MSLSLCIRIQIWNKELSNVNVVERASVLTPGGSRYDLNLFKFGDNEAKTVHAVVKDCLVTVFGGTFGNLTVLSSARGSNPDRSLRSRAH